MTYLDNAATTFPKPESVIREVNLCLRRYCGNPGRSSHSLSVKAAEEIYLTREKVASFIGASLPEGVVFTQNATYALNLAIKTLIPGNCHVLCSDFEHNSVVRPLNKLRRERGIEYSSFSSIEGVESCITDKTKAIVCSIASNVTGETLSLEYLSNIAKEREIKLIIDASQAAGHIPIDLSKTPCDALCAPGHKALFGIQGSGFVYFNETRRGESFIEGGSGSDSENPDMPILLPEAYEAGTLSTPAIVSLRKGVEFVTNVGIENIISHLDMLTERLNNMLCEIKGVKIYNHSSGILSFNYKDISSTVISSLLNDRGICVRGGLHCSPMAHRKLGTLKQGVVRASFSYLNSKRDVDRLYRAMKDIAK